MSQITVRVPASTSNLGPGFDCLGLALKLYNQITVTGGDGNVASPAVGTRPTHKATARQATATTVEIADEVARLFFRKARTKPFRFSCAVTDHIPQRRGLGSSASARAGLLVALNELAGKPLSHSRVFELCTELEGHPDNAAPALFGGFTVVRGPTVQRFAVGKNFRCILLVPDLEIETKRARRILPSRISFAHAVANTGGAAAIVAAFVSQKYEAARGAFADHLHQPARTKLLPFLPDVIAAAEKSGAIGAFLSGSGSTVAAFATSNTTAIARAMKKAAPGDARAIIVAGENNGAFASINRSALR